MARRIGGGSEEGAAITGVVLAVSAASGGMLALIQSVNGTPAVAAVPTLLLLGALLLHAPSVAAWSALGVWVAILPLADGVAILAPMLMIGLCLALAVGPERLVDWVRDEWSGRESETDGAVAAWIEDDRSAQ
jgi:Zn-dependent protease with chaperone function